MTGGDFELSGGFWAGVAEDEFCFGDLDDDNDIDLADLAQLLADYGTPSGAAYEDGDPALLVCLSPSRPTSRSSCSPAFDQVGSGAWCWPEPYTTDSSRVAPE